MKLHDYNIVIMICLSIITTSCTDVLRYYSPTEAGVGERRQSSTRDGNVLDSTTAGLPKFVGSEWVYVDSIYSWPYPGESHDTSVVQIVSVVRDSTNGNVFTYQETNHNGTFTSFVKIKGDTLFSGGIWGGNLIYPFPLNVGNRWLNFYQYGRIDSGFVLRKEPVTVEPGTFEAYVIRDHSWSSAGSSTTDRWYVPEVGIVMIDGYNGGPDAFTVQWRRLVSFRLGPRSR